MALSNDVRILTDGHSSIVIDLVRRLSEGHTLLQRLGNVCIAKYQRAREIEQLYQFSPRELADLGLCKSDLPAIEKGLFRRE